MNYGDMVVYKSKRDPSYREVLLAVGSDTVIDSLGQTSTYTVQEPFLTFSEILTKEDPSWQEYFRIYCQELAEWKASVFSDIHTAEEHINRLDRPCCDSCGVEDF